MKVHVICFAPSAARQFVGRGAHSRAEPEEHVAHIYNEGSDGCLPLAKDGLNNVCFHLTKPLIFIAFILLVLSSVLFRSITALANQQVRPPLMHHPASKVTVAHSFASNLPLGLKALPQALPTALRLAF